MGPQRGLLWLRPKPPTGMILAILPSNFRRMMSLSSYNGWVTLSIRIYLRREQVYDTCIASAIRSHYHLCS